MPKSPQVAALKPLLVVRKQARQLLGCSHNKLVSLEQAGLLTPVRFSDNPLDVVRYRLSEIEALVGETTSTV